jgi:F-type H+-transporting ATPase subunit b
MKYVSSLLVASAIVAPAFAASTEPGGTNFAEGLAYAATDPVTFVALLALLVFLAIAIRMGALKTILGGLDSRADKIALELEEAKTLREQAAEALAAAERKQKDADEEAKAIVAQAKGDAKEMMKEARKDLADRLARREALAETRIARAESDAAEQVRRAAADAATNAAKALLAQDDSTDQFDKAANEIEASLN